MATLFAVLPATTTPFRAAAGIGDFHGNRLCQSGLCLVQGIAALRRDQEAQDPTTV
jgi:hypothetical protein